MIVFMSNSMINPFYLGSCVTETNSDNLMWLIKQFLVLLLCVIMAIAKCMIWDSNGCIIECFFNWLVFQCLYGSFYIVIPFLMLCSMNLVWTIISCFLLSFLKSRNVFKNISGDYVLYFEWVFLLLFTIVHAIAMIIGNGVPRIICSIPNSEYLMPVGCDLSSARDGKYIYYVAQGELYLVDEVGSNGLFIELKVAGKKIVECNLFENSKKVERLYIPCTYPSNSYSDGSYNYTEYTTQKKSFGGFDMDGKAIGADEKYIPEGTSLFWAIILFIVLVLVLLSM